MEKFCFVLCWSFDMTGGVNQVINNLDHELNSSDRYGLKSLALEGGWDSPALRPLPSGTERLYLRFTPPYAATKPVTSALHFVAELPRTLWRLRKLAREHDISVFNVHFPGLEAINLVLLRTFGLFRGPILLSMHGSDIRAAHSEKPLAKWIWRWMLRHASAVIACSDGLREEVLLLEPKTRAVTIYNGIDMTRFRRDDDLTEHLPALQGKKVVVNVGGFEYRKGHDILLRAFAEVAKVRGDVVLLLIGKSGPMSTDVRTFVQENALQDSVIVMENVPHEKIYGFLRQSDVFVLATRWQKKVMGEGFALAILEASAARLPVVATASCGVEELIVNGQTGLVTPLDDSRALSEGMLRMLNDPEEATRMGNALHNVVKNNFTWAKATAEYAALAGDRHSQSPAGETLRQDEILTP